MAKKNYNSELLKQNSKKIGKMIEASEIFKDMVKKYEQLHQQTKEYKNKAPENLEEDQKRKETKKEKLKLKDQINYHIQEYKKDSQLWIQTYGPSCIKE
jgi:uncharacterized protein YdcH (DUF465 family)